MDAYTTVTSLHVEYIRSYVLYMDAYCVECLKSPPVTAHQISAIPYKEFTFALFITLPQPCNNLVAGLVQYQSQPCNNLVIGLVQCQKQVNHKVVTWLPQCCK